MQLGKIILLLGLAAMGAAENDLEADDVPRVCLPACQFSIDLSASCEKSTHGDNDYVRCVCGAADSQTRLTECASCVKDNRRPDSDDDDDRDNDNDDDSDVADLMKDCGWDFNQASGPYPTSAATGAASSSATSSATATVTETSSQTSASASSSDSSNSDSSSVTTPASITTSPPGSMAGALNPKDAVGPFVAAMIMGLPLIL